MEDYGPVELMQTDMTLRDYFAAAALQGMLSNGFMPAGFVKAGLADSYDYPRAAYAAADAMLKERDK